MSINRTGGATIGQSFVLGFALGDETTTITTGTAKLTFTMPFDAVITEVQGSLVTASSSGVPQYDINEGASSILSTKITINVGELTSITAAVPPVISDSAVSKGSLMTCDIDVAGTGAKGPKIFILGYRV